MFGYNKPYLGAIDFSSILYSAAMTSEISLVLNSQDSRAFYPNNTPNDFTVKITPQHSLDGKWKVGVREISHAANVVNMKSSGANTIRLYWLDNNQVPWGNTAIQLPDNASFLTPQDLITYLHQSFTNIPRRTTPVATRHYRLSQLVQLRTNKALWHRVIRKKGNPRALKDVPYIQVHKTWQKATGSMVRVLLKDENQKEYFRKWYHLDVSRFALLNLPVVSNRIIYRAVQDLPSKPQPPKNHTQLTGNHTTFDLSDVAEFSYDPSINKIKLSCKSNKEMVHGIQMSLSRQLAYRMGFLSAPTDPFSNPITQVLGQGKSRIFPYQQQLIKGYETLTVHCSLVQPSQLGDTNGSLLAVLPVLASRKKRDTGLSYFSHIVYKTIEYAPVIQSTFDTIRIQFKSITGEDVKFASGAEETQISLHLKKFT